MGLMKVIGDAASYELCYKVNKCRSRTEDQCLPYCRSGITITASYAIRQSSRLLKVYTSPVSHQ